MDKRYLPYENDKYGSEDLTIGDLLKLGLPDHYKIKFDGFYGFCFKADLIVDPSTEKISVNG
jgi:hypothetical protein